MAPSSLSAFGLTWTTPCYGYWRHRLLFSLSKCQTFLLLCKRLNLTCKGKCREAAHGNLTKRVAVSEIEGSFPLKKRGVQHIVVVRRHLGMEGKGKNIRALCIGNDKGKEESVKHHTGDLVCALLHGPTPAALLYILRSL